MSLVPLPPSTAAFRLSYPSHAQMPCNVSQRELDETYSDGQSVLRCALPRTPRRLPCSPTRVWQVGKVRRWTPFRPVMPCSPRRVRLLVTCIGSFNGASSRRRHKRQRGSERGSERGERVCMSTCFDPVSPRLLQNPRADWRMISHLARACREGCCRRSDICDREQRCARPGPNFQQSPRSSPPDTSAPPHVVPRFYPCTISKRSTIAAHSTRSAMPSSGATVAPSPPPPSSSLRFPRG